MSDVGTASATSSPLIENDTLFLMPVPRHDGGIGDRFKETEDQCSSLGGRGVTKGYIEDEEPFWKINRFRMGNGLEP